MKFSDVLLFSDGFLETYLLKATMWNILRNISLYWSILSIYWVPMLKIFSSKKTSWFQKCQFSSQVLQLHSPMERGDDNHANPLPMTAVLQQYSHVDQCHRQLDQKKRPGESRGNLGNHFRVFKTWKLAKEMLTAHRRSEGRWFW